MLNSLTIYNGNMTSEFNPEVFYYEINLYDGETCLNFDYEASGKVTIYGNDNLTYGDNHILIEVYDDSLVTYTLLVHKEKVETVLKEDVVYDEISIKDSLINDIKTPGIASITFIIIVILYCIIFKRK